MSTSDDPALPDGDPPLLDSDSPDDGAHVEAQEAEHVPPDDGAHVEAQEAEHVPPDDCAHVEAQEVEPGLAPHISNSEMI